MSQNLSEAIAHAHSIMSSQTQHIFMTNQLQLQYIILGRVLNVIKRST